MVSIHGGDGKGCRNGNGSGSFHGSGGDGFSSGIEIASVMIDSIRIPCRSNRNE